MKDSAETPIASWVDWYRFNNSPLSMQVSRCVHNSPLKTSREWSRNKRSKLFCTKFNARVNWITPATRLGDKPSNQSLPRIFYALF